MRRDESWGHFFGPPGGPSTLSILVTGGSGFVGSHVVRLLLEQGEAVRVLMRRTSPPDNLAGLEVECAPGDLRDPASLQRAVRGCRQVFHCAADYRLWTPDPSLLYEVNVQGTEALLLACRENGVERVVYTSSVAAVGIPSDGRPGDEDTPVSLADMIGHYKRSKFLAEEVARRFAAEGDPVVVVNPSTPVGPGDLRPTATGRIITDFLNGRMPAYVQTGLNLVAVEDVARGHLLAAERGVPGRRYILGCQNLTLEEILEELADLTGLPAPRIEIPLVVALGLAHLDEFVSGTLLRREPRVPLEGVRMARKRMWFDSARARDELGYQPGSVRAALERAVRWFVAHGHAPAPPRLRPGRGLPAAAPR